MKRLAVSLTLLALLACAGGNETAPTSGAGGAATTTAATTATNTTTTTSATNGMTSGGGAEAHGAGYGALSGSCGEITLEDLTSPEPELLVNALDFSASPMFDESQLSAEGQAMIAKGNLGGSSLYSEIIAYEVLNRCDHAALVKTEAEIVYATQSKKTDILLAIDGEKVGVSVVRAMSFPEGAPYPVTQAFTVLHGKLADILLSSASVAPEDAWKKQILAVIAQTPEHAAAIADAYAMLDATTKADTIVLVTVTEGTDKFIYYGK